MIEYDYLYETTLTKPKDLTNNIPGEKSIIERIKYATTRLIVQLNSCEYASTDDKKTIRNAIIAIEKEVVSRNAYSRVLEHMLKKANTMINSIKRTPEVLLAFGRWQTLVEASIKSSLK